MVYYWVMKDQAGTGTVSWRNTIEIRDGIYRIEVKDWRPRMFDALVPPPQGTSYNTCLLVGQVVELGRKDDSQHQRRLTKHRRLDTSHRYLPLSVRLP